MSLSSETTLLSLAVFAALAAPASAAAQDGATTTTTTTTTVVTTSESSPRSGRRESTSFFGLRAGFATPSGNIDTEAGKLRDRERGAVLVQADLMFEVLRFLRAGVYGGIGFGLIGDEYKDRCSQSGSDCTSYTWVAGAQGELRLLANNPIDPWIGVSIGVDGVNQDLQVKRDKQRVLKNSLTAWGVDLGVSAGVDFKLGSFALGPYVHGMAGRYNGRSYRFDIDDYYSENDDGSTELKGKPDEHYWITAGLRGTFGL